MRRSVVIVAAAGALAALAAGVAGATSAESRPSTPVREQNLDEDGAIRVRQQGTLDATIGNLPTHESGALRAHIEGVDGTIDVAGTVGVTGTVGVDGTVEVAGTVGLDPAANAVALDPAIQSVLDAMASALGDIKAQLDQFGFDGANLKVVTPSGADVTDLPPATFNPFGFSAGAIFDCESGVSFGPVSTPVLLTGVSFVVNRDAHMIFRRGSTTVHVVFAQANQPTTVDFSHPLLVDGARLQSRHPGAECTTSYGFTGRSTG